MTSEPELPPDLDPRQTRRTGARVIEHGLPGLPEVLTYQMSIPVAYWTVSTCAVVLFLRFQQQDDKFWPKVRMGTYFLEERWTAHSMWAGKSWPHDPIAKPPLRAHPRARYAGHRYQWLRQAHLSTSKPWLAQAMATVENPGHGRGALVRRRGAVRYNDAPGRLAAAWFSP